MSHLGGATGIWWAEPRDVAQHPAMHRTASPPPPTPENALAPGLPEARLSTCQTFVTQPHAWCTVGLQGGFAKKPNE